MAWYLNIVDSKRWIPVNINPVVGCISASQPDLCNAEHAVIVIVNNQPLRYRANGRKYGVKKDSICRERELQRGVVIDLILLLAREEDRHRSSKQDEEQMFPNQYHAAKVVIFSDNN